MARDALLRDLEAISRTARTLALTVPGLEDKFRAHSNLKDKELLTLARSFAQEMLPLKAEFTGLGLPADFLEDMGETLRSLRTPSSANSRGLRLTP